MRTVSLLLLTALLLLLPAQAQSFYSAHPGNSLGFGGAIAATEGTFFIGSSPISWPQGDEPAGSVYVYTQDAAGNWQENGRLTSSDGHLGDHFGRALLARDTQLFIGAPGTGAVYHFEKQATGAWQEAAKITPSTLADGAEFGGAYARGGYRTQTMAYTGDHLFVTAYNNDDATGAVYVFEQEDGQWQETSILPAPDEAEGFGWSLMVAGHTLFVGAPATNERRGAVYAYTQNAAGMWESSGHLMVEDLTPRAALGQSLASAGGHVFVGATGAERIGAVFVFEEADGVWSPVLTLKEGERSEGTRPASSFGSGMVTSGDDLLVGARGRVFAYDVTDLDYGPTPIDAPDERTRRGTFGIGLALHGDVAAIGSPNADYEEGLATFFERNAEHGGWEPIQTAENEVTHLTSISGERIDCQEGEAGVFPCQDVDLISFVSTGELASDRGAKLNDIWGWEDPVTGHEWVLAARTDGLSFVNIGDPSHPVIAGQLMRTAGSPGSSWRDVKVYQDHAFIVSDGAGQHGMQIFDLTQLRDVDPATMPVEFEETAHYTGIASSHNIIINEETGFAYAVGSDSGGEACGGQLHMIDLSDPVNPQFAGCYIYPDSGGTHDAQCVVYQGPDTDYRGQELCFNSNGRSFVIADVTDKSNPQTIVNATYPNTAYTHQGWLTEDHRYFYMNDELDEMNGMVPQTRTLIWDVSDLDDPALVKEYYLESGASDHNLYVKGNYLYESNYQGGLYILDISDPENPVQVGHFDTAPFADNVYGFGGSWSNYPFFKSGIIAVSSQAEGLFLVKKRTIDL